MKKICHIYSSNFIQHSRYAVFVGIHLETRNAAQAHDTCAFLAWHRKYLLAFENMLRSFGPEFLCLTLPYWDYFAEYADFITGECLTFESCSPIMRGLGGSNGHRKSVRVPGASRTFRENCVSGSPCGAACPMSLSSFGSSSCAECIHRGEWHNMQYPSGLGYVLSFVWFVLMMMMMFCEDLSEYL